MEQFQGKRIIGKTKFNASQIVSCFKLVSTFLLGLCALGGGVSNLGWFEVEINLSKFLKFENILNNFEHKLFTV